MDLDLIFKLLYIITSKVIDNFFIIFFIIIFLINVKIVKEIKGGGIL